MELKTISEDNDIINKIKLRKNISSLDLKIKRDYNVFLKKLNAQNVDDLDALYFFGKVNHRQNSYDKKQKNNNKLWLFVQENFCYLTGTMVYYNWVRV